MEEIKRNAQFQNQLNNKQHYEDSPLSSKSLSTLREVQPTQKYQDSISVVNANKKTSMALPKNTYQIKKEYQNILKLDSKSKNNCVKISLNSLRKPLGCQTNKNENILLQQKFKTPLKCKALLKNVNDLCIVSQRIKQALLRHQQTQYSSKVNKNLKNLRKFYNTSRLIGKQNNLVNERELTYKKSEQQNGYQKRIKRVKTHQNVIKQMFTRYDYFANDKNQIKSIVNRIKGSFKRNVITGYQSDYV